MDYNELLNKNVIKILEVLRKDRLYFSQIYEKTRIKSKNNILKNLDVMVNFGILKKDKGKGNTFYMINYDNIVSIGLLELIDSMRLQNLPFNRRKAIIEVVDSLKPEIGVVFGSTAKGGFGKNSDIDLLIVFEENVKNVNETIKKISSKYGVEINVNIISMEEFKSKRSEIKHIMKTGFPVRGKREFYEVFRDV